MNSRTCPCADARVGRQRQQHLGKDNTDSPGSTRHAQSHRSVADRRGLASPRPGDAPRAVARLHPPRHRPPVPRTGLSLATGQQRRRLAVPQGPGSPAWATQPFECEAKCAHHRPLPPSGTRLLKRVLGIHLERCPTCGGGWKISAAFLERPVSEMILGPFGGRVFVCRSPPRTQELPTACCCASYVHRKR